MKKPKGLIFVKLGGSLITDKKQPLTARPDIIRQISIEIAAVRDQFPSMPLLIGHGSGSYGHAVAHKYHTQQGGEGAAYWHGFAEVWQAARKLNQIVVEECHQAGLPIIAFPPSAAVIAKNKAFKRWDLQPMQFALSHNLIPLIQGDVIFDNDLGGTIFSTEELFHYLCGKLHPERILLAGLDKGVYINPTEPGDIFPKITPANYKDVESALSGSQATDVTGGMIAKVKLMLELVQNYPSLIIQIFSGAEPDNIKKALAGESLGTTITA
jgi:isopentenyl phosphate kinase